MPKIVNNKERDNNMYKDRILNNFTYDKLAAKYKVTRERTRQIINKRYKTSHRILAKILYDLQVITLISGGINNKRDIINKTGNSIDGVIYNYRIR